MINLYRSAMRTVVPQWHASYREMCSRIAEVQDWRNPEQAPDAFLDDVIYRESNGVSSLGQAFLRFPVDERPPATAFRDAIQQLKEGLTGRYPADNVRTSREVFYRIAGGHRIASIFNRVVAGLVPDRVSPVIFNVDFQDAYDKLTNERDGYFQNVRVRLGEDEWFAKNVWLMSQIRARLPDGPCEGACEGADVIDDFSRGIFVWGVHETDWGEWQVLRRHLGW